MLDVPAEPQAVKAALDAFFAARTGLFGAVQVEAHEDEMCIRDSYNTVASCRACGFHPD